MVTREDSSSSGSTGWTSPADALRQLQQLGAQLSSAVRSMADELSGSPASQLAEPVARLGQRMVELSTLWVTPVRAVLDEQQQLIDAVSSWANEQRKLADRFSELAARHRQLTEQVMAAITPTLDQVDKLAGRTQKRSTATKKKTTTTT